MKLSKFIVLILLPAFVYAGKSVDSSYKWNGKYEYVDTNSDTEYPIIIGYEVTIIGKNCRLTIVGYQSDEDIICSIESKEDNLTIKFVSYHDGKIENKYGFIIYSPGAILLSMKRESNGKIMTTWGKIKPDMVKENSGVYLEKK